MGKTRNTGHLVDAISQDSLANVTLDNQLTVTTILNATANTGKFLVSDNGTLKFRTAAEMVADLGIASSDTNFANTDLTFTGDRIHTLGIHSLSFVQGTSSYFTFEPGMLEYYLYSANNSFENQVSTRVSNSSANYDLALNGPGKWSGLSSSLSSASSFFNAYAGGSGGKAASVSVQVNTSNQSVLTLQSSDGNVIIDRLLSSASTDDKMMVWDSANNKVGYRALPAFTDTNFANTNLTFTGSRTHLLGAHTYTLTSQPANNNDYIEVQYVNGYLNHQITRSVGNARWYSYVDSSYAIQEINAQRGSKNAQFILYSNGTESSVELYGDAYFLDALATGSAAHDVMVYDSGEIRKVAKATYLAGYVNAAPLHQILYGTGTGVTSSANLTYDGSVFTVHNGNNAAKLSWNGSVLDVGGGNNSDAIRINSLAGTGSLFLQTTNTASYVRAQQDLSLGSGASNDRVIIKSNGNVLINTATDAGYRLDVNGTTKLRGNLEFNHGTLTISNEGGSAIINHTGTSSLTIQAFDGVILHGSQITLGSAVGVAYIKANGITYVPNPFAGDRVNADETVNGAFFFNSTLQRMRMWTGGGAGSWKSVAFLDDIASSGLSIPVNEIVYGTGTSVTSSQRLQFNSASGVLNIGGGTVTNPKLVIQGDSVNSFYPEIVLSGVGSASLMGYQNSLLYNAASHWFRNNNGSATFALIYSDGNVNIGPSQVNSGYKLNVEGTLQATVGDFGGGNYPRVSIGTTANSTDVRWQFWINNFMDDTLILSKQLYDFSVRQDLFFFRANGNLSIGNASDAGYKLDVNGTVAIRASSYALDFTNLGAISWGTGGAKRWTLGGSPIAGNEVTGSFNIYNNTLGSTRLSITEAGSVLIGTITDAGYKLDVNGTARVNGNLTTGNNIFLNNSEFDFRLQADDGFNNSGIGTPRNLSITVGTSSSFLLQNATQTKRWIYAASDNLYVGNFAISNWGLLLNTTSGIARFSSLYTGNAAPATTGATKMVITDTIGQLSFADIVSPANFAIPNNEIVFGTGAGVTSSPFYSVDSSGGFGVLQVSGPGQGGMIRLVGQAAVPSQNWNINAHSTGQFRIWDGNQGVARFAMTPAGNVMIGTTTDAGYKLDVNGSTIIRGVSSSPALKLEQTTNQVYGGWLDITHAGLYAPFTGVKVDISQQNGSTQPFFMGGTRSGNAAGVFIMDRPLGSFSNSWYSVGINAHAYTGDGTTATAGNAIAVYAKGQALAGSTGIAYSFYGDGGIMYNQGFIKQGASATTTAGNTIGNVFHQYLGVTTGNNAAVVGGLSTKAVFYGYDYSGNVFMDTEIGNNLMVKAATGNVLIGTTTDSGYKLDVNGTIKAKTTIDIDYTTVTRHTVQYAGYGLTVWGNGSSVISPVGIHLHNTSLATNAASMISFGRGTEATTDAKIARLNDVNRLEVTGTAPGTNIVALRLQANWSGDVDIYSPFLALPALTAKGVTGNILIRVLSTGLTAPTTSGTTKMVITDANGQLSFADIPSGGTSIAIPNNELVFGTGTGVTSNANLTYNGSILIASGGASGEVRSYGADYSVFNVAAGSSSWDIETYNSNTQLRIGRRANFTAQTFFSNGNIGIGTTTDAGYKLNVHGNTRIYPTSAAQTTFFVGGNPESSSPLSNFSINYHNGTQMENALRLERTNAGGGSSLSGPAVLIDYRVPFINTNPGVIVDVRGRLAYLKSSIGIRSLMSLDNPNINGIAYGGWFETDYSVANSNAFTAYGIYAKATHGFNNALAWAVYADGGNSYFKDNVLIGTTTDAGYKLAVNGDIFVGSVINYFNFNPTSQQGEFRGNAAVLTLRRDTPTGTNQLFRVSDTTSGGFIRLGGSASADFLPSMTFRASSTFNSAIIINEAISDSGSLPAIVLDGRTVTNAALVNKDLFGVSNLLDYKLLIKANGNVLIGTTTDNSYRLRVSGSIYQSGDNGNGYTRIEANGNAALITLVSTGSNIQIGRLGHLSLLQNSTDGGILMQSGAYLAVETGGTLRIGNNMGVNHTYIGNFTGSTLTVNGLTTLTRLATTLTAPATTGTTKMVITDQNGLLSFADIPSGGGGNIYNTDGTITADRTVSFGTNNFMKLYRQSTPTGSAAVDFTLTWPLADLSSNINLNEDGIWVTFGDATQIGYGQGTIYLGRSVFRHTALSGTGTRMVVADANGVISTQPIPTGGGGSTAWADITSKPNGGEFIFNQNATPQTGTFDITGSATARGGVYVAAPVDISDAGYRTGTIKLPQLEIEAAQRDVVGGKFIIRAGGWHTSTWFGRNAMANWTNSGGAAATQTTAFGVGALEFSTTGNNNDAFGAYALRNLTTSTENVAIGRSSIGLLTTGSANTATGLVTLYDLLTGSYNTALGNRSGRGITTGSFNTIIGANIQGLAADLEKTVIIASGEGGTGAYRIYSPSTGNILIGTTTDAGYKLDVNGSFRSTIADSVIQHTSTYFQIQQNGTNTNVYYIARGAISQYLTYNAAGSLVGGIVNENGSFQVRSAGVTNFQPNGTGLPQVIIGGATYMLDVIGNSRIQGQLYINSGAYIQGGAGKISFLTSTNSAALTEHGGILINAGYGAITPPTNGLYVSGGTRLAVDSGNVLIGTTTDQGYKLDVNGSLKTTDDITLYKTGATGMFQMGSTGVGSPGVLRVTAGVAGVEYRSRLNYWQTFSVTNDDTTIINALAIGSQGNVAIGTYGSTVGATYKFEVFGTAAIRGNLNLNSGSANTAVINRVSTTTLVSTWEADVNNGFRVYSYDATILDYTFSVSFDGKLYGRSLRTTSTAPSTNGTTKMVITDQNGLLSFADIPSGGGGGTTLYSGNGSLSSNRTVTGAGFSLTFSGTSQFTVASTPVTLDGTVLKFTGLDTNGGIFETAEGFVIYDPNTDDVGYASYGSILGSYVNVFDPQTIYSKRIVTRTGTVTTGTTITPTSDDSDMFIISAQGSATFTMAAPSGSPLDGQKLLLRFKPTVNVTSITWNVVYRSVAAALPATMTSGKVTYVGLVYNTQDARWDCVAAGQQP
jgi:hypothetical protein